MKAKESPTSKYKMKESEDLKMEETLKRMLAELQTIKEGQSKIEQRMEALESGQKDLKYDIQKQINGLTEKILEKIDQKTTEIKSEVRHVATTQEEQRSVIDLLSSRSIQHEAALKRKN
ncbi:hypothetical protein [Aneurinibacillus migulanus]|uniref:hypothetical protein n=1 Tax=Aneurinibacillus migulanus TaxID=47500 RepID=UPI0011142FAA|nr:hypothetical protein [Aneurinibacillus migulanus]MED0892593.1 hypothetical protein [Aneurinibacillus migulanus]MED1614993.1 hypothetical protein [Aneurinibacillus migulanus]GED16949.1 hypothetical protein AMI01nite_49400 [Aneurinibacillus migulanus]